MKARGKQILIFIDTVAEKNKLQVQAIQQAGFSAVFFVYRAAHHPFLHSSKQLLLSKNILRQLRDVGKYVRKHRKDIHHFEIYPGNYMASYYLLLAAVFDIKVICAERGDLNYYHKKGYALLLRMNMWLCYKFSTVVWYREPFMKPLLEKLGAKKLFFLHNAVDISQNLWVPFENRDIHFLWMNRILPQRRSDWFIRALRLRAFSKTNNYLLGLLANSPYKKEQDEVLNSGLPNLNSQEFCTRPAEYFQRARFFAFPADRVFANHALLEAMANGVVPLVSETAGAELIVENGVNGFTFEHNYEAFERAMLRANELCEEEWQQMSVKAMEKASTSFSPSKYKEGLLQLYSLL